MYGGHMKKKKILLIAGLVMLVCSQVYARDPRFLSIGTASTGGAFYPIGISMAELISKEVGINTSAIVTGGAVENNSLIEKENVDIAITMSFMAYNASKGLSPYTKPQPNVNVLFSGLSKGVFHIVVNKNSDIYSISDLKGKKVALGPAGGGAIAVANDIFSYYNLGEDDFKPVYISYAQAADSLTDGNVDAVVVQSAAPASAISNLTAARKPIRILSIEDDVLNKLLAQAPYFSKEVLPKSMYGTDTDIVTVYTPLVVVVRKDLSEDLVYRITKSIFENQDLIRNSHPSAKEFSLDIATEAVPTTIHPGAARYFREQGKL